jgi:hypothetical protein
MPISFMDHSLGLSNLLTDISSFEIFGFWMTATDEFEGVTPFLHLKTFCVESFGERNT